MQQQRTTKKIHSEAFTELFNDKRSMVLSRGILILVACFFAIAALFFLVKRGYELPATVSVADMAVVSNDLLLSIQGNTQKISKGNWVYLYAATSSNKEEVVGGKISNAQHKIGHNIYRIELEKDIPEQWRNGGSFPVKVKFAENLVHIIFY